MTDPKASEKAMTVEQRAENILDLLDRAMGSRRLPLDGSGKEEREQGLAFVVHALREYGDQRERAAVLTAAKAVCGSCAFEEPVTVAGIPGFWHSRVMCAASHIYDAFPNLDSREVKREG
jgi:hypothetical protein